MMPITKNRIYSLDYNFVTKFLYRKIALKKDPPANIKRCQYKEGTKHIKVGINSKTRE